MNEKKAVSDRTAFAQKGGVKTLSKSDIKRMNIEQELGTTLRRQNYVTADLVLANGPEKDFDKNIGQRAVEKAETDKGLQVNLAAIAKNNKALSN